MRNGPQERYNVPRQCPAVIFFNPRRKLIHHDLIAEILCGSLKDVKHRRNIVSKAIEELLASPEAVSGRSLTLNVGLVNGDEIILEYSEPRSLKYKVNAEGGKG